MQAADASFNGLGTRIVASPHLKIHASTDTAVVSVSPGALYADRADHRSHITVVLRDANGTGLPDGTKAAITVQDFTTIANSAYVRSAGGSLLNIPAVNGSYALGTMSGGQISFDYSDS